MGESSGDIYCGIAPYLAMTRGEKVRSDNMAIPLHKLSRRLQLRIARWGTSTVLVFCVFQPAFAGRDKNLAILGAVRLLLV